MDDTEYSEIINFLSNYNFPKRINTRTDRSNFRKKCKKFNVEKDQLYFKNKKKNILRRVVKAEEKNDIIRICHVNEKDNLHMGLNRT